MRPTIVEQYISSKTQNPDECEDIIVLTDDYSCVVDGATSSHDFSGIRKRGGRLAAELISEAIQYMSPRADKVQAVRHINHHIANYYISSGTYETLLANPIGRPTASIVMFSHYRREIWMVGDCQCKIDSKVYRNEKIIDSILADARAICLEIQIAQGVSTEELLRNDIGRTFIAPIIESQQVFQNNKEENQYTYGVIDGFDLLEKHIIRIKVRPENHFIVLASDGYPELHEDLLSTEAHLKFLIEQDPLCIRHFKSTKGVYEGNISFDDRAYVRLDLTSMH